jgi:hypothetical protein
VTTVVPHHIPEWFARVSLYNSKGKNEKPIVKIRKLDTGY